MLDVRVTGTFWKGTLEVGEQPLEKTAQPRGGICHLCSNGFPCGPSEPRAEGFILGGFPDFLGAKASAASPSS